MQVFLLQHLFQLHLVIFLDLLQDHSITKELQFLHFNVHFSYGSEQWKLDQSSGQCKQLFVISTWYPHGEGKFFTRYIFRRRISTENPTLIFTLDMFILSIWFRFMYSVFCLWEDMNINYMFLIQHFIVLVSWWLWTSHLLDFNQSKPQNIWLPLVYLLFYRYD